MVRWLLHLRDVVYTCTCTPSYCRLNCKLFSQLQPPSTCTCITLHMHTPPSHAPWHPPSP
jgi:hypothetical protein